MIQQLYAVERQAKQEKLTPEQTKTLRLEKSLPVVNELGKWIFEEIKNTLPKSQIGKAMAYAYARWDKRIKFGEEPVLFTDYTWPLFGKLQFDNSTGPME